MDLFGIAASGLQAAGTQLAVTAGNIANSDTPDYQARRADLVELSDGGVAVSGISTDTSAGPIDSDGKTGSNVDLTRETVNLKSEQILYTANAAVFRAADRMYGTLLDMFDNDRKPQSADNP